MKIEITKDDKALRQVKLDIPDFTVLTGLNGSGKTQILEGIAGVKFRVDSDRYTASRYKDENRFVFLYNDEVRLDLIKYVFTPNFKPVIFGVAKGVDRFFEEYYQIKDTPDIPSQLQAIYKTISELSKSPIADLQKEDFEKYLPITDLTRPSDIFQRDFSMLINSYARAYEQNNYNKAKLERGAKNHKYIDVEKFTELYGEEPWIIFNELLDIAKLDYKINEPDLIEYDRDSNYVFQLKKTDGTIIHIDDISSGEKVLMSLVFAAYNDKFNVEFPQVLLLDEPDSSLHPAMCQQLVDVLYELFVKRRGVKVIMTTHSPSTVALCPEESIYVINKTSGSNQIEKVAKDEALKVLTSGIPTLSIDYSGHKQIIVESPTDEYYYRTLFNKLLEKGQTANKLYFIASGGYGKGSCDQVKKITNDFRAAGSKSVFGLIDWDTSNVSDNEVKVHGEGKRYNIESYLFDPIYIIMLFIKDKSENVCRDLKFSASFNEYELGEENETRLEECVNWYFDKLSQSRSFRQNNSNTESRKVSFYNGRTYSLPAWYIDFSGHDLVDKLKTVFKSLDKPLYKSEGKLQKDLTDIVGKSYPFIPLDTFQVFEFFR